MLIISVCTLCYQSYHAKLRVTSEGWLWKLHPFVNYLYSLFVWHKALICSQVTKSSIWFALLDLNPLPISLRSGFESLIRNTNIICKCSSRFLLKVLILWNCNHRTHCYNSISSPHSSDHFVTSNIERMFISSQLICLEFSPRFKCIDCYQFPLYVCVH